MIVSVAPGAGGGSVFNPGPLLSGVAGNNSDTTLHTPPAPGDLIFGNSSNLWAALPVSGDGLVLTLVGGLPSWQPAAASGANTALSNLASVAVNLALTPGTDNSIAVNSAAKRYTSIFLSTGVAVLQSASDANPASLLGKATLVFGAGGGSAVDVGLTRAAAGVFRISDGGSGVGTFQMVATKYVNLGSVSGSIATDASASNRISLTLNGNGILANPTNPTDGQTIVWRVSQDAGGSRTLGADSKFRFSTAVPDFGIVGTPSSVSYITATYNLAADLWDVLATSPGYGP